MTGKREQKKRIKDCLSQLKYLDSVYAAEIKKPEAEQDADLLEECLETMAYLHDVVESLSRQTQVQRSGVGNRIMLRRVAIVVIALAVLLIGMSVAEAAGFRIWSALVHWDSRYLHITYVPQDQELLPDIGYLEGNEADNAEGGINDEIVCDTTEDLVRKLSIQLMLPSYLPDGMKETFVSYSKSELDTTLLQVIILWENEKNYISYYVTYSESEEWVSSLTYRQTDALVERNIINGIEFIFAEGQVQWVFDHSIYLLETNLDKEELMILLNSLSY